MVTGILDVVPEGERDVADIPGPVIERARLAVRRKHGHARRAREVILPLVVIRVPMHFPHTTRLDFHQRRRHGLRNGEIGGIDDAHRSARGHHRFLGKQPVGKALGNRVVRIRHRLAGERAGHLRLENVALLRRNIGKSAFRDAEIRRQHILRHVRKPVGNGKGVEVGEVTVVKDEQKLATFLEPLNRMGNARGKVPQVAHADIGNKIPPVRIDRGNARPPRNHERPFRLLVPMQLAHSARRQAHVDPRQRGRDRQLPHRHFP